MFTDWMSEIFGTAKSIAWPAALGAFTSLIIFYSLLSQGVELPFDETRAIAFGGLGGTGLSGLVQFMYRLFLKESWDDASFERRKEVAQRNHENNQTTLAQYRWTLQRLSLLQSNNQSINTPLTAEETKIYMELGAEDLLDINADRPRAPQREKERKREKRRR